jgi:cyclin-dependent kinase regulatory subunit CKS1
MNRMKIEEMQRNIYYSDKYYDDEYEYRHVVLPKEMVKLVPKTHLMSEEEWRGIGVQQSKGWVHYMTHSPGECRTIGPYCKKYDFELCRTTHPAI